MPPITISSSSARAGLPSRSRWVRVASFPQTTQIAESFVTSSARAMSSGMVANGRPAKSWSRPLTITVRGAATICSMMAGSSGPKNCASSIATASGLIRATSLRIASASGATTLGNRVPVRLTTSPGATRVSRAGVMRSTLCPAICRRVRRRTTSAVLPLLMQPAITWSQGRRGIGMGGIVADPVTIVTLGPPSQEFTKR